MPNTLGNRVKMSVSGTPGTGTITLDSAVSGFQTFAAAGIPNAATVPYVIEDGSNWEIGVGTYTSSGTTLARTSVTASSNSGSAISATSSAIVMISPLAGDLQAGTAAGNLVQLDGSAKIGTALIPSITQSMLGTNIGGTGPAFLAYENNSGSPYSITASTWSKIKIDTEVFDTNNNFDNATNYRFTPTIAGYYQINGKIDSQSSSVTPTRTIAAIYKNGSEAHRGCDALVSGAITSVVSNVVYFNGSTDYVELYGYVATTGTASINNGSVITYFSGAFVRSA